MRSRNSAFTNRRDIPEQQHPALHLRTQRDLALLLGVPIFQRPLFCRRNARGPHPGRRLEVRGDVRERPRIPLPRPLRRRPRPQADQVRWSGRAIRPSADRRRRWDRAAWAIAPKCKEAERRENDEMDGFWDRTYPEVKKELMGRYPRHYWPDNPRAAKATAKVKPREK